MSNKQVNKAIQTRHIARKSFMHRSASMKQLDNNDQFYPDHVQDLTPPAQVALWAAVERMSPRQASALADRIDEASARITNGHTELSRIDPTGEIFTDSDIAIYNQETDGMA